MNKAKVEFQDCNCVSVCITSSWKAAKENVPKKNIRCQTTPELYAFTTMETQTSANSDVLQDIVKERNKGMSLVDHFAGKHRKIQPEKWRSLIEDGFVTVDCETVTDPDFLVETDMVLEFNDVKSNDASQTVSFPFENRGEGKESETSSKLQRFLSRVAPQVITELENNLHDKSFELFDFSSNQGIDAGGIDEGVNYWKMLSVDLEKRKVVYPDWSKARYLNGTITKCGLTRNKERVYDIEYEDGVTLQGVREEYVRMYGGYVTAGDKRSAAGAGGAANTTAAAMLLKLQEGVRVHLKTTNKSGQIKYLPGRIVKVTRSTGVGGGNLYDIEVEGARTENGRLAEDLIIGLSEGQQVEAKRPNKVTLQCTGISWNATGNSLAVSYGKNDILGWCDFPGAICCWNIFGKNLNPEQPDFVLDHVSCLMSVAYHPLVPSLVAGGSFNGEIIVWDLSRLDSADASQPQPYAITPIMEYGHKEPVLDLRWMYDPSMPSSSLGGSWILCSVGSDGKMLYWTLGNKLKHPIKGVTLASKKSSSRRYPPAHGATTVAFTNTAVSSTGGSGGEGRLARPNWLLIGQEGGGIVRGQVSRILAGANLTAEAFKALPPVDEVFPPLRKTQDKFGHEPHIGGVSALECSPFHRNLFISSGGDGLVKLFHMLEKAPLLQWEPAPLSSSTGGTVSGGQRAGPSFISSVRFSPIRPCVFAAASSDGHLFLYDLSVNVHTPIKVLEAPFTNPLAPADAATAAAGVNGGKGGRSKSSSNENKLNRVGITGVAFNPKQRDLIAACDWLGRVHIWKLNWRLANKTPQDLLVLNEIGSIKVEASDD